MNIMLKLLVTIQCQINSLHSAKGRKRQHENLKTHLQNAKENYVNKSNITTKKNHNMEIYIIKH